MIGAGSVAILARRPTTEIDGVYMGARDRAYLDATGLACGRSHAPWPRRDQEAYEGNTGWRPRLWQYISAKVPN